jgi:hypothetical protein
MKILIRFVKKPVTGFLTLIFITLISFPSFAQEGWTLSTSLQYAGGNYIYNNANRIFYFYGGVGYQTKKWSFNLSVPLVAQNNNGISQVGGMMLPNGNSNNANRSETGGEFGGMMGNGGGRSSSLSHTNYGLGDTYIYGSYFFIDELTSPVAINFNSFVKVPTANNSEGIGTGKLDFGLSVTLKKNLSTIVVFGDLGYINIGNPPNAQLNNPVSYGFGIGKLFDDSNYSLLLYYQGYSTIIKGYESPRQLSLGLNYKINSQLNFSLIGSAGLSKVTSAFSFSTGLKWII